MTAKDRASRKGEASPYANGETFARIFREDLTELYRLSFLLTGDRQRAEKCFVSGIEDCVKENHVFREWARSWAKRTIIRNAIRELNPRPSRSVSSSEIPALSPSQQSNSSASLSAVEAVLRLRDFERFVFIMSVLERYSQHDCALLLGSSISEVRAAHTRALDALASTRSTISFPSANAPVAGFSVGA
jgi:RNA polymerase sigma factor (sigma-70 family)